MPVNIFWTGGTGANIAMAFVRMQYLGFIPYNQDINHLFIDSPENFSTLAESNKRNINIGLNELLVLKIKPDPQNLNLTSVTYDTFESFLNNHPQLGPLYKGIPEYERIAKTPVKDGNYYMPAIAAAMASVEFIEGRTVPSAQYSIICASSYGGTGAGVSPILARYLLNEGHQVDVVYLNSWLVNTQKSDIHEVIQNNEIANWKYFTYLKEHMSELKIPDKLEYYLFRVPYKWQQSSPTNKASNTIYEIENPYPYFIASHICRLLKGASGKIKKGGIFDVNIDTNNIWRNPFFTHAYAYSRLIETADRELPQGFKFIIPLMETDNPSWGLRNLLWEKDAFENVKQSEYGSDEKKNEVRRNLQNRLFVDANEEHPLDWTGFMVKPLDELPHTGIPLKLVAYPSIFASYFYVTSHLDNNLELMEAYLALIAMIASKKVYAEYHPFLAKHRYQNETGTMPICFKDASDVLGYAGKKGLYAWPLLGKAEQLRRELKNNQRLQEVLHKMKEYNGEDKFWKRDSYLGKCLNTWTGINPRTSSPPKVWLNLEFFKDIVFLNTNEEAPSGEKITQLRTRNELIVIQYPNERTLELNGKDHNLVVLEEEKRLVQYTNMLKEGYDKKVYRDETKHILILNYRTYLNLSETGYEVEIIHPSHIFVNRTFEFAKAASQQVSESIVPWPLRKEYINCLIPDLPDKGGDWYSDTGVNYPSIVGETVDMTPHEIKNWGRVKDVDQVNSDAFRIRIDSTMITGSETKLKRSGNTYQGYVWPCDRVRKRFLKDWQYYSILITGRPEKKPLFGSVGGKDENWYYRTSDSSWNKCNEVYPDTHIASWTGKPPVGIVLEITGDLGLQYGGYFPIMEEIESTPVNNDPLEIGIDLGTLNSCAAFRLPDGTPRVVTMNPSDLLYTVFSSNLWHQEKIDFAWIPVFSPNKGTAQVFPTGLFNFKQDDWRNVTIMPSGTELEYRQLNPHIPLSHYTIPGDTLNDTIAHISDLCVYNIKWEGELSTRLVYWKDFLTCYLLFLQAHFFMKGQLDSRYNKFLIHASIPLKFELEKIDLSAFDIRLTNLQQAYIKTFKAAKNETAKLTGLILDFIEEIKYESVAPIQGNLAGVALVVDVGGGTTDVAVIQNNYCIATSSFRFAGNNPFKKVYGNEYLRRQRYFGIKSEQQPLEGQGTLVSHFIHVLSAYTALLACSAIYQTKLHEDIQKADNTQAKDLIMGGFKIHLFGRGWHLAILHPEMSGKHEAESFYVSEVIKKKIITLFNNCICPKVFGNDFPKLKESNIDISNNPHDSKTACSLGTISLRNTVTVEQSIHDKTTFMGITYSDTAGNQYKWYESYGLNPISHPNQIDVDDISPRLLMKKDALQQLFDSRFNDMNQGNPFRLGRVVRNFAEYLLECRIGGFDGDKAGSITMNTEFIEDEKSLMDSFCGDSQASKTYVTSKKIEKTDNANDVAGKEANVEVNGS